VGKKDDLAEMVDEVLDNVGEDRDRLSEFFDKLLQSEGVDPEHVAKIAAELTRQNQVKAATIKALGKVVPTDDSDDDFSDEIGRPFPEEEADEGSN
jgi:hypothetical protein